MFKLISKIPLMWLATFVASRYFFNNKSSPNMIKNIRRAAIFYFMSGMFAIATILLIYFGIYLILINFGLSNIASLSIVGLLMIATSFIFYYLAKKYIKLNQALKKGQNFITNFTSWEHKAESLAKSFMDGFINEGK